MGPQCFNGTVLRNQCRINGIMTRTDIVTVSEAFEATTTVSYTNTDDETIEVSILSAERRQGFVDTPWYYTPVVINWYIYK